MMQSTSLVSTPFVWQRRSGKLSVGPILLGFFFVVIVGSSARGGEPK
jgi:hypothetical protein